MENNLGGWELCYLPVFDMSTSSLKLALGVAIQLPCAEQVLWQEDLLFLPRNEIKARRVCGCEWGGQVF